MKYLKMLGLAAIAAMGLMAFLGAGTASATVLCEGTTPGGSDCGGSGTSVVTPTTPLDFSLRRGTSELFKGPFGETIDTCTESTVKGKTGDAGAGAGSTTETVAGSIEELTFANCTHPVTVNALGTFEVHYIAGTDNGTFRSNGATVVFHNTLLGTCQVSTPHLAIGTLIGTSVTGGAPVVDIKGTIPSENCVDMTWTGTFEYTGTTNFNVAAS